MSDRPPRSLQEQMAPYKAKATAVVITTAMLSFISYWRAAAIVLCDLASTAYYVCGIAEQAVGKAAPWMIAIVLLVLANAVRATYIESCGMFVRAGVYRVVRHALGGRIAKVSLSALLFDYLLTGPISAVSAGTYIAGFINDLLRMGGIELTLPPPTTATVFALAVTAFFWRENVLGIKESSQKAKRIMEATAVMVVILITWSLITLILHPAPLPPLAPELTPEAWGWLGGIDWIKSIGAVGVMVAIGHSILAMSGEETLAQVYREIAKPKLKNMKKAAVIIFIFAFCFTALISFFAVMIIPDDVRPRFADNLISGLVMHLAGPEKLKLVFQGVVVVIGAIILSGAVNTAMVGANGVLNRAAEDNVLPEWLRHPHRRYGTTSRIIGIFAALQAVIILICWGDVYLMGEAYAFGIVWSFATQTMAVAVLRFKDKSPREWKVPFNITIRGTEIPLGLIATFLALFFVAMANLLTKTVATKAGVIFTISLFIVLSVIEAYNKRRGAGPMQEKVNVAFHDELTPEACGCIHAHRVVVPVRDPNSLLQLINAIEEKSLHETDLIVLTVEPLPLTSKDRDEGMEVLPHADRDLLTHVVATAEKHGAHLIPLVISGKDPIYAIAKSAFLLDASEIIVGRSEQVGPEVQMERIAMAWGFVAGESGRKITVKIVWPQHELKYVIG